MVNVFHGLAKIALKVQLTFAGYTSFPSLKPVYVSNASTISHESPALLPRCSGPAGGIFIRSNRLLRTTLLAATYILALDLCLLPPHGGWQGSAESIT